MCCICKKMLKLNREIYSISGSINEKQTLFLNKINYLQSSEHDWVKPAMTDF